MMQTSINNLVQRIKLAVHVEQASDAELLDAFVGVGCDSAFTELLRRHGPMVWGVCLRMASGREDAEDCFQATFLVLLRKAATIHPRSHVGGWLHGVAYHTALKARAAARKRGRHEQQYESLPERSEALVPDRDLRGILDQELNGLPEKYRVPIVLCEIEDRTIKDVAEQLGCPTGTIAARLARGRTLLARRLAKHGVSGGAIAVTAMLARQASAASPVLAIATPTANVASLAKSTILALFLIKLKPALISIAAMLLLTIGLGSWIGYALSMESKADPVIAPPPPANEVLAVPARVQPIAETIAWGPAQGDLEFGLSLAAKTTTYAISDRIEFHTHVRCTGKKAVSFEQYRIAPENEGVVRGCDPTVSPLFESAKGQLILGNWTLPKGALVYPPKRTITVAPGEVVRIGSIDWSLKANQHRSVTLDPGIYTVHFKSLMVGKTRPTGKLKVRIVLPADNALAPGWGKEVNGLRFGLEFKNRWNIYHEVRQSVPFVLKAVNVTDKAITFEQVQITGTMSMVKETINAAIPVVIDSKGKRVAAHPLAVAGIPPRAEVRKLSVQPGETILLGEVAYAVGKGTIMPVILAGPGIYRVSFETVCWLPGHQRPTGTLDLDIRSND